MAEMKKVKYRREENLPKFKIEQQEVKMCCLTLAHMPAGTHRLPMGPCSVG